MRNVNIYVAVLACLFVWGGITESIYDLKQTPCVEYIINNRGALKQYDISNPNCFGLKANTLCNGYYEFIAITYVDSNSCEIICYSNADSWVYRIRHIFDGRSHREQQLAPDTKKFFVDISAEESKNYRTIDEVVLLSIIEGKLKMKK